MSALSILSEERLEALRRAVSLRLGAHRLRHTLGVEEAIASLGALYLPQDVLRLRAAALLHDITKEWTAEEHISFCRKQNILLSHEEIAAPKVLHAKSGAVVAALDYSEFVDDEIVEAIRQHTVAAPRMSLFSSLLYLADYIEPTRTYPECVALRQAFYEGYNEREKHSHLARIMARALQEAIDEVGSKGGNVLVDTLEALSFFKEAAKKR